MCLSARSMKLGIASVVLLFWPMVAAAAESAAEKAEQESLFSGDLGNVFWTVLIFAGLLIVLGAYAWRPMLDALNRREEFIRQTVENARKERSEAERTLAEYRGLMARSKQEAQALIDQGRKDAEELRQRLHQQAQAESEQIIQRARQEISLSKQSALQELKSVAADLSVNVAGKIIARSLSAADQQRLVDESLKQLIESGSGRS